MCLTELSLLLLLQYINLTIAAPASSAASLGIFQASAINSNANITVLDSTDFNSSFFQNFLNQPTSVDYIRFKVHYTDTTLLLVPQRDTPLDARSISFVLTNTLNIVLDHIRFNGDSTLPAALDPYSSVSVLHTPAFDMNCKFEVVSLPDQQCRQMTWGLVRDTLMGLDQYESMSHGYEKILFGVEDE
ncbi:hypothetical protein MMC28_009550 [Mycoblastus sanguinarius]|nr:hypothetical protein [Mycoblastus sanguinarius]